MTKRFRVAFSFTGENRAFVASVARILAARFGESAILYDEYHEAEFARVDLALHIGGLYSRETDLIVVVLSRNYTTSEWCGLEWKAIYGLVKQRRHSEVMLARFDLADAEELFGLAGFVDLDLKSPQQAATRIFERLAVNEGLSRSHYFDMSTPDTGLHWPASVPTLQWPVANHSEARSAFAELLTDAARFRLLTIHGSSETGKSHLSRQFLRNALTIPELSCGRFDFKGSVDMAFELRAFADCLQVDAPPSAQGVSAQLASILSSLRRRAQPTLLIFDSFELAGDGESWIKQCLLVSLVRAHWLRVAITGQRPVAPHGQAWAGCSLEPIELRPPTPHEWFDYAQVHKPTLPYDFVVKAHECCGGKSALLAQLLGPHT